MKEAWTQKNAVCIAETSRSVVNEDHTTATRRLATSAPEVWAL